MRRKVLVAHLARRIVHGGWRSLHGVLRRVWMRGWLMWYNLSQRLRAIVRAGRVGVRVMRVVVRWSRHGMGPRPRQKVFGRVSALSR